jgi:hypothetical protein
MAEIISPEDNQPQMPPQAMQAVQHMQGQLQALTQLNQKLEMEIQQLNQEKHGKIIDNEYRVRIEQMKIEADLAKAEITTKSQNLNERVQFIEDMWKQFHSQAHEATQADLDRQQEQQQQQAMMAQQAQQAQQQQSPNGGQPEAQGAAQ